MSTYQSLQVNFNQSDLPGPKKIYCKGFIYLLETNCNNVFSKT